MSPADQHHSTPPPRWLGVGVAYDAAVEPFLVSVPEAVDFVALHLPWLALADARRRGAPRQRLRVGEIAAWWPVVGHGLFGEGLPEELRALVSELRMDWVSGRGPLPELGVAALEDGPRWAGEGPRRLNLPLLLDLAGRRGREALALLDELDLAEVHELHIGAALPHGHEPFSPEQRRLLEAAAPRCPQLQAVTVSFPTAWLGRAGALAVEGELAAVRERVGRRG